MTAAHSLAGKRVIVTGAAQGLGREFALHLAAHGARVLAADVQQAPLRETAERASERGTPILTCTADVSDHQQTVTLAQTAGRGSIVNMASEVAFSGSPGLAHYVASKAAMIGLTRTLARELGPAEIRVNALAPGFIPTESSARLLTGPAYDTTATPLGRVGQPTDLLGALAFLISDDSAFITGQTLLVNGGRLLH